MNNPSSFFKPVKGTRESGALLGFAVWIVFSLWLLIGPVLGLLGELIEAQPAGEYIGILLQFSVLIGLTWFAPRILGRDPRTLLSVSGEFSISQYSFGAVSWLALLIVLSAVEAIAGGDFTWSFQWSNLPLALAILILVLPIQTMAEELFFRGLLPQALAPVLRSDWAIALGVGVLFALPHFANPEVNGQYGYALLAYGALGAGWAYAASRAGTLAIAAGAHLANNAFGLLVIGYANSPLTPVSVWLTGAPDLSTEAWRTVLGMGLWLVLTELWRRREAN